MARQMKIPTMPPLMVSAKKLGATTRSKIRDPGSSNQSASMITDVICEIVNRKKPWLFKREREAKWVLSVEQNPVSLNGDQTWKTLGKEQAQYNSYKSNPLSDLSTALLSPRKEPSIKLLKDEIKSWWNVIWVTKNVIKLSRKRIFTSVCRTTMKEDWGRCMGLKG